VLKASAIRLLAGRRVPKRGCNVRKRAPHYQPGLSAKATTAAHLAAAEVIAIRLRSPAVAPPAARQLQYERHAQQQNHATEQRPLHCRSAGTSTRAGCGLREHAIADCIWPQPQQHRLIDVEQLK